jgi:hypothetical protein
MELIPPCSAEGGARECFGRSIAACPYFTSFPTQIFKQPLDSLHRIHDPPQGPVFQGSANKKASSLRQ